MAVTPTIQDSQGSALAVYRFVTTGLRLPQGSTLGVINFPTEGLESSQGYVTTVLNRHNPMLVSQAQTLVVAAGRVENFFLRAWTFTMDDHDFYVLHLGEDSTIVYDTSTGQWMTWESEHRDTPVWKASTGTTWQAIPLYQYNSDSVCGDDTTGMLYWLNPQQAADNTNTDTDGTAFETFERVLTGGIPARGRGNTACNLVFLTASLGNPWPGSQILLKTSDDLGKTWIDNGYITINPNEWDQDVTWPSLGSFGAPGRIFEIVDNGAIERIDSLDMK